MSLYYCVATFLNFPSHSLFSWVMVSYCQPLPHSHPMAHEEKTGKIRIKNRSSITNKIPCKTHLPASIYAHICMIDFLCSYLRPTHPQPLYFLQHFSFLCCIIFSFSLSINLAKTATISLALKESSVDDQ